MPTTWTDHMVRPALAVLTLAAVLTAGVALGVVLLLGMLLDPADVGAVG